jgi:hypothetical protein
MFDLGQICICTKSYFRAYEDCVNEKLTILNSEYFDFTKNVFRNEEKR